MISDHEELARFIVRGSHIRADGTVRRDAFMPPPSDSNLSVTKMTALTESRIWQLGHRIAAGIRDASLHGRADVLAKAVRARALDVVDDPVEDNANHAHITGWPDDKPSRMNLAMELAATARFVPLASSEQS